jgi:hypothetical protein
LNVALMGPAYAGKSTLATELVEHHGFTLVSYTDLLKSKAAEALCAIGLPTSVTDIVTNKIFYRALLQDLGTVLGFDQGEFVEEAVERAGATEHIVFDNVRFLPQWERLVPLGFTLVYLAITPMEQEVRARDAGLSADALGKVLAHPAEVGFPLPEGTIILPHEWSTATKVSSLLEQLQAKETSHVE